MRLYNTKTRTKEDFVPRGDLVRLYVCGVTPYDTTHVGHAFTYVAFDVLVRYLNHLGLRVRYAQNVTDVDDDILRKAREVGESWDALAEREFARYRKDMAALHVRPPDVYPRATQEVPQMIELVESLLRTGHAYRANGNIYFRVASAADYGQLSRLSEPEMISVARERGGYPDDKRKSNPLDFVLWQESAPGEPSWPSPWGPGRPGWHIECSAMAMRYLGLPIDIHGGGADLVFPHHESEIAQSEYATGQTPFVRYWMHTAMVHMAGEKMSKSLGNLVMVSKVLTDHSADALRLYLLSHHYRQEWEYDDKGLQAAVKLASRLDRAAARNAPNDTSTSPEVVALGEQFTAAMDDDLDTPQAIEVLERLAALATAESPAEGASEALRRLGCVLGLSFDS